jgi:hypothetical protein
MMMDSNTQTGWAFPMVHVHILYVIFNAPLETSILLLAANATTHSAPHAASLSVVARDEERRCDDEDAAHGLVVVHRVYLKVAGPRDCPCQTARSL